jgi:FlaA1/EpsC-like NDP-sugar epimerase
MGGLFVDKILPLVYRARLPVVLALGSTLTALSYFLALCLRFEFDTSEILTLTRLWLPLALLLFFRRAAYTYWGLNQAYWRYATAHDLVNIFKAHLVSSLCLMASIGFLRLPGFPRSVLIIEFALSILIHGGARFCVRLGREYFMAKLQNGSEGEARQVIVLGAGDSGHLLIKNLFGHTRLRYVPVAILDDSERFAGTTIHGVPVVGPLSALERCLDEYPHVSAVIAAIPSLSQARFGQIEAVCKRVGVALKKLQAFEDIACRDADMIQESLSIEAVLEKEVHVEYEGEIRDALAGKRVLITGAGGSIGSELVRQVIPFAPAEIVLLDHSEYNIFKIGRELSDKYPSAKCRLVIANICNEQRLLSVFEEHKPQIVFHAAAYKHVPLMEENPYEAFHNNVVGTRNVIRAADVTGAERFVLISTDKAVDPSSLMGCSKRIAEMLVQCYSANGNGAPRKMNTAMVRFGNVINSAGSVVPTFKEQILSGGPITVTHPDMERYFMSIREAVRLVLMAGMLGGGGEIYVLDMGRPIKVVDVARKMRALYGRRDIPIEFCGIRPGEKLKETLVADGERKRKTRFEKVDRLDARMEPGEDVFRWVAETAGKLDGDCGVEISNLMRAVVVTAQVRGTGERERQQAG